MRFVPRACIAAAIIVVAVVFGCKMQSEIPTDADRRIAEEYVEARNNAFRTQDASAYQALFTPEFQMIGNPMAFGEYPPSIVETVIKNVPFEMIDVTSTVKVMLVKERGSDTRQITFLARSHWRSGESGGLDGFTVMFIRRDGVWKVLRFEQY